MVTKTCYPEKKHTKDGNGKRVQENSRIAEIIQKIPKEQLMFKSIWILVIASLLIGCGKTELRDKLNDTLIELSRTKNVLREVQNDTEVLNQSLSKVEAELKTTKSQLEKTKAELNNIKKAGGDIDIAKVLDQTQTELKTTKAELYKSEVSRKRLHQRANTAHCKFKSNKYGVTIPITRIGSHFLLYSEKPEGLVFTAPRELRGILRKIDAKEITLLGTHLHQKDQVLIIAFDSIIGYRLLPKPE